MSIHSKFYVTKTFNGIENSTTVPLNNSFMTESSTGE